MRGTPRHTPEVQTSSHGHRLIAGAEIAALTAQLDLPVTDRASVAARIREVALANMLVSAETSLIVFDNDADESRALGLAPVGDALPPPVANGSAPTIDPTSTSQGITLDKDYVRNIATWLQTATTLSMAG